MDIVHRFIYTRHLYGLQADPYELTNLIGHESHTEVCQVMQACLIRRMLAVGEAAPTIEPVPQRQPIDQWRVSIEEANA